MKIKIGITLIATGFEHKNPFDKKLPPKEEVKKEEKIVMTLNFSEDQKKIYQQPNLKFGDDLLIEKAVVKKEPEEKKEILPVAIESPLELTDMSPTIVELPSVNIVEIRKENAKTTGDKLAAQMFHFELLSEENLVPAESNPTAEVPKIEVNKQGINKEAVAIPPSGSYLVKPSQIYEEDKSNLKSNVEEEPTPLHLLSQEDEPVIEMQLVVKDSSGAVEQVKPDVKQAHSINVPSVEEPPVVDDTDEQQRRRAKERIAKLRNLSFNLNAADPNNEFESVPAYLRRNTELHNSIADVESFYSNYTVKSDQNNQAEIGTINTFLDGKKPD